MKNRGSRTALVVVGVVAVIVGGVFAGQGANLIPGSSMTGERMWLYIGAVIVAVGAGLLFLGLRRPGRGRSDR